MADYKLSNEAKEDLIRIHHYGVEKFGLAQADKYWIPANIKPFELKVIKLRNEIVKKISQNYILYSLSYWRVECVEK